MNQLPEGLSIRSATNSDVEGIRRLVHGILREYGMTPDPAHADKGLEDIEANFKDGMFDVLVDQTGDIVGSIGVLPSSNQRCDLVKMFLTPEKRGQGLGWFLMNHAKNFALKSGFNVIELETDKTLVEAVQLYKRAGFVEQNRENIYDRCNMVMRLTLS